jgi:hypothetical protein
VVEQPIRNRQVESSTLSLGSNILPQINTLRTSVHRPLGHRCMIVAYSKFFAQRIHRIHLRFTQRSYVMFIVRATLLWRKIAWMVLWSTPRS